MKFNMKSQYFTISIKLSVIFFNLKNFIIKIKWVYFCPKNYILCFHNQVVNLKPSAHWQYEDSVFGYKTLKQNRYYNNQKNVTKMNHSFMHLTKLDGYCDTRFETYSSILG
jgi:hypothetical protein